MSNSATVKRVRWLLTAVPLAMCSTISNAADTSVDALQARMRGAYELQEWHAADGQVFRPPAIEGRFVILDGSITAIFTDRMKAPTTTTLVAFGKYTLDSQRFAYAYDSTSMLTESASGTTVSHKPLWKGLRSFAVSTEDGTLRLRTEGGKQEFVFTATGVTYSQGGVSRVWRRISE